MKKLIFTLLISLFTLNSVAQKDVTKFLGIPVDGTKAEMIRKLKAKGFQTSQYSTVDLVGEFNGADVYISIITNNNKVFRIVVEDQISLNETDIKIRFNQLCRQFENNSKYYNPYGNQSIGNNESVFSKMLLNERIEATYFQHSNQNKVVWFMIEKVKYVNGEYRIRMFYDNEYNRANGEDL